MNEATIATTVSGAGPVAAKRPLGFWMCTALVIGNTIGMGIFLQPASLAPYGYNALIAWAITIFGTVLLALISVLQLKDLVFTLVGSGAGQILSGAAAVAIALAALLWPKNVETA